MFMGTSVISETTVQPLTNLEDSTLDPSLLDPEITKYFSIPQLDDPLLCSEVGFQPQTQHSLQTLADEPDTTWMSPFETEFQSFLAEPLLDSTGIPTTAPIDSEPPGVYSVFGEDRSISISPAMLDKSAHSGQENVVWYSKGKEMQVGGRRPPRSVAQKKHKGKRTKKPSEDYVSPEEPKRVVRPRHEMSVETGLDTVKRIKLVFHEDLIAPPNPSTSIDPNDAAPLSQSPDAHQLDETNITPPVNIDDRAPIVSEMDLEDTPDSIPVSATNSKTQIVIPEKKIDKALYPTFLGQNARQTMITNKITGKVKGIMYNW